MAKERCVPQRRCNHVVRSEAMQTYEIEHWAESLDPAQGRRPSPAPPSYTPQGSWSHRRRAGREVGVISTLQQAAKFSGSLLSCPSQGGELASESVESVRNNACFAFLHLDFSICSWEYCLHTGGNQRWKRKCLFGRDFGGYVLCVMIHPFCNKLNIY